MSGIFIEIKKLDLLVAKLNEFPRKMQRSSLSKGLRAGAKEITEAAKNFAPVRTGALKAGIKVRAAKRKKGRVGVVVQLSAKTMTKKGKTLDSFYAPFLEYGTKFGKKNTAEGKPTGGVRIKQLGFLAKAARQKGKEATRTARDVIWGEIDKALVG